MIIKFSLSGGSWITGEKVDQIFNEVTQYGFSASPLTGCWISAKKRGSINLTLNQISARFSIDYLTASEFLQMQSWFVRGRIVEEETVKDIYFKMMGIRDTVKDEDELAEESND